tara:strand:- start:571 stop:825 length:255 start_codon:yes stop_codon:yes gene_type:complete
MNFTLELNKKKLDAIASAVQVVAENINTQIRLDQVHLKSIEQLNLSTSEMGGIKDLEIQKLNSNIKFLQSQEGVLLEIIKLASK